MMKLLHRYNFLFASAVYCILFFLLLPLHRFVFDVDGVGYSLVAQHLAEGNFERAINGFWSPLHSWIVAPFIKTGLPVQTIFFCSNAVISVVILYLLKQFSVRLSLTPSQITVLLLASTVLLIQFSFYELAADILLLPFIISWLLLVMRADFCTNYKVQLGCGLLIGFGYLAKTYALPFLGTIHILLLLRHYYITGQNITRQLFLFLLMLGIVCVPWILIISNKYGYFTIGNASRLNLSWFLRGMSDEQSFFHAPTYNDSPGWWEDPSYYKGEVVNMFSSGTYFLKQVKVFLHNGIIFSKTFFQISIVAPLVIIGFLATAVRKKEEPFQKLSIFLVLFPIGYLLTFVDGRYLWIYNVLLLPLGLVLLDRLMNFYQLKSSTKQFFLAMYTVSFLVFPVYTLQQNATNPQWKQIHDIANWFKQNSITQNFTSNRKSSEAQVIAYKSGTRHFQLSNVNVTPAEIASAMQQHTIQHLLYFYTLQKQKEEVVTTMLQYNYKVAEIQPGVLLFSQNK
ncbi:MAG: hypothetical protein KGZ74_12155 [Chitinophagaceae bacterium]|nr:hypothetical protein [Chitinophagaceae bacterium]